MKNKYAILVDGGYFTKVFYDSCKRFPTSDEVEKLMKDIQESLELRDKELLRIFYYDAPPAQSKIKNPISMQEIDLGSSDLAKKARQLHTSLSRKPDFALRMGELKTRSWTLKKGVFKRMKRATQAAEENAPPQSFSIYAGDLRPEIEQKGVDLKIGMDIASMAIRQTVDTIVMFTGDSDLVPALKLARREGLRVICARFDTRALTDELIIHSDKVLELSCACL